MPICPTNDIHLHYERVGAGRPFVLIPGMAYGAGFWRPLVPGLAAAYDTVSISNRGTEASAKPPGPYSSRQMADDVAGLLDALGLTDAVVLGHSLGGFIAQELTIARPDLVAHLILAGTSFGGPNVVPPTPEALSVMLNRDGTVEELVRRGVKIGAAPGFPERRPDIVDELVAYRLENPFPPDLLQAHIMAGYTHNTEDRVSSISCPTLILCGEHDQTVPVANGHRLRERIAGAKIEIIPETGHLFPIEAPEATVAAILKFLDQGI